MEKNQRSGCLPALAIVGSLLVAQILAQYSSLSFGCSFLILATCCLLVYYVLTFIKLADIRKQGIRGGHREDIGISLMLSVVPLGLLILLCAHIARPLLPNWRGGPVPVDVSKVLAGTSLPEWVVVKGTECTGIRGPWSRQISHDEDSEQAGPLARGRVRADTTVYEEYRGHLLLDPADPALDAWPAIAQDLKSLVALDVDAMPEPNLRTQLTPLLNHLHGLLVDFHPGRGVRILDSLGRRTHKYVKQGDDSISFVLGPENEYWDGVKPAAEENQYATLDLSHKPGQQYHMAVKDLQIQARRMLGSISPGTTVTGNLEGTDLFPCRERSWWTVYMLAALAVLLVVVVTVASLVRRAVH